MTNDTEIAFVGSREVRSFPKGWQHPRDASGRYMPLLPGELHSTTTSPSVRR